MKNDLSHLSENELNELKEKYYGKSNVKKLVEEYGLNIRPGNLYKFFPAEQTDIPCPFCKISMIKPPVSKSEINYNYRDRLICCPKCEHNNRRNCRCTGCIEEAKNWRQREQEKKYDVLKKMIDRASSDPVPIETASLLERIYLGAMLRSLLDENLQTIHPVRELYTSFAPYYKFEHSIFKELEHKGFIKVDLKKCLHEYNVIMLDSEKAEVSYSWKGLVYQVNFFSETLSHEEVIDSLINSEIEISEDELMEIWKLVALNECYEYMNYTVGTLFNFDYNFGPKAELIFNDLLQKYSVGQVFNIIYSRSNYALRYKTEQRINSKHAANSILTMIANYSERIEIEKWNLKNFNRPSDHQESILSKFFFGRILKIGDKGFNCPPIKSSLIIE